MNKVVVAGGDVVTDLGETTITFEKLTLDDADMRAKCRQLIQWTYPVVMPPAGGGGSSNLVIPELVFSWGNFVFGLPFQPVIIYLSSVEVEYFRFTERGAATRAHVSISCKVKIKAPPGQNPTSGGKPGRGGHQVIDGQNIQGIALSRYGDPKRWRDLADANGIDDPLRVRAGDVLYLPNRGELGRAAR
ncbi:MAG TPA: hypothetical protein VFX16_28295 [Pseudonocardiaceae bacterium]|nr:hypothetical protein [Pseudonocardiaceae bacterium]